MEKETNEILSMPIDMVNFSARACSRLKRFNVNTVEELVQKTEDELFYRALVGRKCLKEIKEFLSEHNLHLGINLENSDSSD